LDGKVTPASENSNSYRGFNLVLTTNQRVLTLIVLSLGLFAGPLKAQTVTTFEGIDASQVSDPEYAVDANGAVGTKQFMEYTNVYFQAYDKVTQAPVWSTPQSATSPWKNNGITACNAIVNDAMIIFDRLALRWVIAGHTTATNNYNYCVAISNTDDLTSPSLAWYTYVFPLNSVLGTNSEGEVYFPDWPKIATWPDAYYVTIDLNDLNLSFREVGILVCALDRTDMLVNGTANTPICLGQMSSPDTSIYLAHSLIPADVEGTTPPPAGRDEFLTSIENPVLGGGAVTSTTFNLWDFHLDWTNPSQSTLTESSITEAPYQPGCYTVGNPVDTICVPEPSTSSTDNYIDSVGDRFMPRMSYRNFGTYESFVVSHAVQAASSSKQTAVRWYELRDNGSGTPSLYQDGNISPDKTTYRFMPSIAEDANGNAAVGYNISSSITHPGMNASYFSLTNPAAPTEITLYDGAGDEENTWHMGSYASMTVDPEDGCTFWYVAQYFPTNQTGPPAWGSRISNFAVPGCGNPTLSPGSLTFAGQPVGVASAPQNVTLINSQQVTLNINSITFTGTDSGDFSQTNNCGSSLAAGATCAISVTFTPGGTGTRTAVLNVNDDGPNSPQTAGLTGTGITPVTLSSGSIAFGSVLVGSSSTAKPVTLTNNQSVPLTNIIVSISGSAAYSQVNTCGTSIPASGQCTITVTFAPTTTGQQTGTVSITDSASNSPQTISLTGSGQLPLGLSPASLNFGDVDVGTTSAAKNINVTNHEKVTVTFTSIVIDGTDSRDFAQTNNCTSLSSGATCTVSVTFTPSTKGALTAILTLTDSATSSPQTAKLSGTGEN
jgi:Abnormal spindle-like microcephaly-assoc'd, ASPM-SPD-2-Hydin